MSNQSYAQFRQPDGTFLSPDGAEWDNEAEFIQGHVLGFCPCGNPGNTLQFLRDVMLLIDDLKQVWEEKMTMTEWESRETDLGVGPVHFAYYFLDSKGLTEHGGCVPGWLTPSGIEMLEALKRLYPTTPSPSD